MFYNRTKSKTDELVFLVLFGVKNPAVGELKKVKLLLSIVGYPTDVRRNVLRGKWSFSNSTIQSYSNRYDLQALLL